MICWLSAFLALGDVRKEHHVMPYVTEVVAMVTREADSADVAVDEHVVDKVNYCRMAAADIAIVILAHWF
jgi:hypothetical protein